MVRELVLKMLASAASVAAIAGSSIASAAPFFISYGGQISGSSFSGINKGQAYTVSLVFDNGNSTVASQTWNGTHLTCVLFSMNNAGNVTFAQDLAATQANLVVQGSASTNAGGILTSNFSVVA